MAKPYEAEVILDADGKPLFSAVDTLQNKINAIGKTIREIQNSSFKTVNDFNKTLDTNIKSLQTALGQVRTLSTQTPKQNDIEQAYKQRAARAKQTAKEETAAFSAADKQQAAESKAYYNEVVAARKAAQRQLVADELAGERAIAKANAEQFQRDMTAARLLREARLEAARAGMIDKARGITSVDLASGVKADSGARLRQLRAERDLATDPAIARDLAQRIELEKAFGREVDSVTKRLERSNNTAASRLAGYNNAKAKALVPGDVSAAVAANPGGAIAQRQIYMADQLIAREALLKAETVSEGSAALKNLQIAEARVRAVNQLVAAEERAARAQQQGNQPAAKTPLQNILSPGYAASALARTAVYGVAAAGAYALFNAVSQSVQGVIQLEDEFARLQGISNSTDSEMQGVKATIFAIGEGSRFAVDDLVKMSQTLAQAGVGAADLGKVLSSVTTLATASGSTPDEAVQLVTSALGAFQLSASEAARVADLMTTALNRTKLTVAQVGAAIQYVGATAYEQNISLETLLATIGAVAQGGVKSGSTIGTGMRQFLVDLQTPSEKLTFELQRLGITQDQVNVKIHGFANVLELLKEKGFGATQAYDGLETRAAAFYLVAKNNVDVIDKLQLAFNVSGAAAIANERSMNSLAAQWQRFKNILQEGFASSMEGTMDALKNILDALSNRILEMRKEVLELKNAQNDPSTPWYKKDVSPYLAKGLEKGLNFTGNLLQNNDSNNASTIFGANFSTESGWGTWIDTLGGVIKKQDEAKASLEIYGDAIKQASKKVEDHSQSILEVDKEMERLKGQQSELTSNTIRAQAETVTLTARFGGLVKFLKNTKDVYGDLIQAMGQYRAEESRFLGVAYEGQAAAQDKQNNLDSASLQSTIRTIKGNPEILKLLTGQERNMLNSPGNVNFVATFREAGARIAKINSDFANILDNASIFASRLYAGQTSSAFSKTQAGLARAAGTGLGQEAQNNLPGYEARLTALSTQDQGGRTKAGNALAAEIRAYRDRLVPRLAINTGENKAYIQQVISTLDGLLQQIAAAIKPSQEDIKDAKRQAAEVRAADAEARRFPAITASDIDNEGKALGLRLGRGHDESDRARATENYLHRIGKTKATADTSDHTRKGSLARDFALPAGTSDAEAELMATTLRNRYKAKGIDARVKYENGKGANNGTGPHIHVGVRKGQRFTKDKTEETAAAYDSTLDEYQLALDTKDYQQKIKQLGKATTAETFSTGVDAAKKALDKVNEDVRTAAKNELASQGLAKGDPKFDQKMAQVEQTITQNTEAMFDSIADALVKSITAQLSTAKKAFDEAVAPALNASKLADARLGGLDYSSNRGKIPDFVRILAEKRAADAKETADRVTSAALPSEISRLQGNLATDTANLSTLPRYDKDGNELASYQKAAEAVHTLSMQIEELIAQKQALDAGLDAASQIPTTLAAGWRQAVDAYGIAHNMSNTFVQDMNLNMTGAIDQVSSGLTTMFTDIMSGSKSALAAFGDFAMGIIKYIEQIAAQAVAKQILSLLFKVVGAVGGSGGSFDGTSASGASFDANSLDSFSFGSFEGGKMDWGSRYASRKGYLSGGKVMNGNAMQDSVTARLARKEWVINSDAAASVGDSFMNNLNQHGAKALDALNQSPQVNVVPKQEMAVYVVSPDHPPQMGKNDVLLSIQEDILRGGETKKLIKFVAQGG